MGDSLHVPATKPTGGHGEQALGRRASAEAKVDGLEFGGPVGCFLIMLWSHCQLYFFWYCVFHNGSSIYVTDWRHMISTVLAECQPSARALGVYTAFILVQGLLAATIPGLQVLGYPLPHENGRRLTYCCNGLGCWFVTLAGIWLLHRTGTFNLGEVTRDLGAYMSSAILIADVTAVGAFFGAKVAGTTHRMTGISLYDFFMGAPLNPRIFNLDLKMFTEARVSWIVLFLLTASAAVCQWQQSGVVSYPMWFMVTAHGLYTHTIMRGEEGIPVTWDIFYEKWGWMLIFWNLAGVPFTYCYQSFVILSRPATSEPHPAFTLACFALLIASYMIWDISNSQRCYFRMQMEGTFRRRLGLYLPWLPGRILKVRLLVRRP